MSCGCASEPLVEGYRQYDESESVWCTCCNRIFCKVHGRIHGRRLKKNKILPMSVTPESYARRTNRRKSLL